MAISVPIWPGSSSFTIGSAPFGFYDTDNDFTSSEDKVANWCARRLGYPIMDVELQDIHFYTCFEEAVTEYSNQVNQFSIRDNMFLLQGSSTGTSLNGSAIQPTLGRLIGISKAYGTEAGYGGRIAYKSASLEIRANQQTYDLSQLTLENTSDANLHLEIKRIFHYTPPALVRYFDPFAGTGAGSQQLLETFGWGNYSPAVSFVLMPLYHDLLRLQAIEFNDMIRRSGYSFELTGNKFKIFPIPPYDFTLWMQYITTEERDALLFANPTGSVSDFSNAPYDKLVYKNINDPGKQWIFKYTLALAKEVLGNIRNKYSNVPIP
ncbi:MAG: hypothetical protein ACO3UU_16040, partial [Minisyncoccia bacterium]